MNRKENTGAASLRALFEPESIAIIGASSNPEKAGSLIVQNLIDHQYAGKVIPVNPNEDSINGLSTYPSVRAIPKPVDLVFVTVPAPSVKAVIEDCVANKAKFGVIISAGFKETSTLGEKLEKEIVSIASKGGMRLLGPNTIGFVNANARIIGTAVPFKVWRNGGTAIAAQSGVFAGAVADWVMDTQKMGISMVVGLGNKCDINECDVLDYAGSDDRIRALGVYVEAIADGRRFIEIARDVTRKKPVVVVKSSRTQAGAKAASSHTGSLATNDAVVDGALKQCGVIRASDFQEMLDYLKAFDYQPLPKGKRVGILTLSGASGVLAVDVLSRLGLEVATLSEETKRKIESSIMPAWQPVANPVDVWVALGAGAEKVHRVALEGLLNDKNVDSVIAILLGLRPALHDVAQVFKDLKQRFSDKPVIAAVKGGALANQWFNDLENVRIPTYPGPNGSERAARTLGAMYSYKRYLEKPVSKKK